MSQESNWSPAAFPEIPWFQSPEAFMNRISFPRFLFTGVLFLLAACQAVQPFSPASRPGDRVAGMNLTTGIQGIKPLQAFCSTTQQSGTSMISECSVPATARLPIGQIFMLADHPLNRLDLEAFGTFKYAVPSIPSSPSPFKEVFRIVEAWDVVLTDLTPGEHIVT